MSGWQQIDGLDEIVGDADVPKPDVAMVAKTEGANVVRLSFRPGQVMADHRAPRPILVLGQRGEVVVTIGDDTLTLRPGSAIHIDAQVTHALRADAEAAVTLLVLEQPERA